MKEAIVAAGPKVTIQDIPIPTPEPNQVVIRVIVSGSNPKDWKIPDIIDKYNANSGDDIAGIVHSVGSSVYEFQPGDRVASFHEMLTPGGSFAEYAVGWSWTTFHIPPNVSFEEAATVPLAGMTAAMGMYLRLGLPDPWTRVSEGVQTPLVVYGGAAAVGAYAIKLAVLSNIHPIIAVAGRGAKFVEELIDRSKGDTIVDYRQGDKAVVQGIHDALNGQDLHYAFDATSEHGSYTNIVKVLQPRGRITLVLPGRKYEGIPETVVKTVTTVGDAHKGDREFAFVYFRYLARGLAEGWFKAHPFEVVPGGLEGVETGLRNLKDGMASAVKYVFRIGETEGAEK
jgi:NADPH2:quinone reductase